MTIKKVAVLLIAVVIVSLFSSCQNNGGTSSISNSSSGASTEENLTDFDENISALAKSLLTELKDNNSTEVSLYYVKDTTAVFTGYKPLADFKKYGKLSTFDKIIGKDAVSSFKDSLKLENWQSGEEMAKSMPIMTFYFGDSFVLHLEDASNGSAVASLNTADAKAFFKIPIEVYNALIALKK